jgi:alpha-glucosidase
MPRISAIAVFVLFFVAVVSMGRSARTSNRGEAGGAVVAFTDDFHGAPSSAAKTGDAAGPRIRAIEPPERDFYAKLLDYDGIPIKASKQVSDEALFQAKARLAMMLEKLPAVRRKLKTAGAELHIIGKNQVTSDLPEHRHLKGKPFDGKLTVDERTRGLGGLLTSCGEENLLRLAEDRYKGRDICVHEFAHCIRNHGIPKAVRDKFDEQSKRSLAKGLWVGSYAASNPDEFFAELSMWYFGTHGDLHMKGEKPAVGREGLRAYDPEAAALFDDFYRGKMEISDK